jgi:ribonuclease HI
MIRITRGQQIHVTLPTMRRVGRVRTIGGCTQFLTMAQGMPPNIEDTITKIIRNFMWNDDSSPRLALDILYRQIKEGGLNVLDIKTRNEAIELMWLKTYLNISASRPAWASVTDLLIDIAAPPPTIQKARINPFLQSWRPATRGTRANQMGSDAIRMLRIAKKYNTNLAPLRLSAHLHAQLPAWYHLAANQKPMTNATARCLLYTHDVTRVADLVRVSERNRNPNREPEAPHLQIRFCYCRDCSRDRELGCQNPHACAVEAQSRIDLIVPKLNPFSPGYDHGDLTLTDRRKQWNVSAKAQNADVLFDPSITCKTDISDCFRIFTDPTRISNLPARRGPPRETRLRLQEITVYTDGACFRNGKANARSGGGVWFGPNDDRNSAIRVPGPQQSNQAGEIVAIIAAIEKTPINQPLRIISDSKYVIEGLTSNLTKWEDQGWIGTKNAKLFKRAAFLLKRRTATTSFKWVKGHSGDQGNEGSDQLAKEGANKEHADPMDMSVPPEFDLQGAKLITLRQCMAYKGIRERKPAYQRRTTSINLQRTRDALTDFNGEVETDETIWGSIHHPDIRIKIRQFLYKALHGTQKIGNFWKNIPEYEERSECQRCLTTESMEHILIHCDEPATRIIWSMARNLWPHNSPPWPDISLRTVLGCGALTPPTNPNPDQRRHTKGAMRLMRILISESAHLIWTIQCERVIREKTHSRQEIEQKWTQAINRRLTNDKITATKVKGDIAQIRKTRNTWEAVLGKTGKLPGRWIYLREVLVGTRSRV